MENGSNNNRLQQRPSPSPEGCAVAPVVVVTWGAVGGIFALSLFEFGKYMIEDIPNTASAIANAAINAAETPVGKVALIGAGLLTAVSVLSLGTLLGISKLRLRLAERNLARSRKRTQRYLESHRAELQQILSNLPDRRTDNKNN